MRKILLYVLLLTLGINYNAKAHGFDAVNNGKTIYYNITSSTAPYTAEVTFKGIDYTLYNEYSEAISIPETVFYNNKDYLVTSINNYAFYGCSGLTSITIPNSVTWIGSDAFYECSGLTSIVLPNSITSIGNYAFYGCSGLSSITIPNSVTLIGDHTFENCSGLTSITIPNSVTSIGNWAFYDCSGLTSINIPNSITSIGDYAFCGCSGLTSIIIPNSVTSIGDGVFMGCYGLTSINIPNSITSIGSDAFFICTGLTSINIPNSVTSIGDGAFRFCSGLTSIIFPTSITSIGDNTFAYCSGLTSITCAALIPPIIWSSTFEGVEKTIPVYIPIGTKSAYQTAPYWSMFSNFIEKEISVPASIFQEREFKLYPNPTNNKSYLKIEGLNSEADVLVYDMIGRVIQTHKINQGTKELEIDLSGYTKGVYSIRIMNDNINQTKKLIVQ